MEQTHQNLVSRLLQFVRHPGFQKYFYNTGWMFLEKGFRLISGLFIGAYVARYLGPGNYGVLNYALSLVALFSVVATLGLDTLIIRKLVHDEDVNVVMGTAFRLRLIAATAVFATVCVFVFVTEPDPSIRTMELVIGAGVFFELFGIIDLFFQARVQSKYVVWSQLVALTAVSAFRLILIWSNASLGAFAFTYVLDFGLLAVGLLFFFQKQGGHISRWKFKKKTARELLRDSWPMILASLSITIYMRMGQLMIRWMLGDVASGNYGVAVRLAEMWNFFPMVVCASLFPAIISAKKAGVGIYERRVQRLYDLMVIISLGIAIPTTFLAGTIVHFLFGDAYQSAADILVIYIWSGVFVFLGVANGKWIISENLQIFRMTNLILAGILNIILNYVLIQSIGVLGSAYAALASQAFAGYFSFIFTTRTRVAFWSMTRSFNPIRLIKLFTSRNANLFE